MYLAGMRAFAVFLVLLFSGRVQGQCTYTWERNSEDSSGSYEQHTASDSYIIGPDGYKLTKKFLDSLISDVGKQQDKYAIVIKDSAKFRSKDPDVDSYIDTIKASTLDAGGHVLASKDFRLFRFKDKDIVHYETRRYNIGEDSVDVHQFEYCQKEWSEDYAHNIIMYTREFGVIAEMQGIAGDPTGTDMRLAYNSCFSKEKNSLIRQLLDEMDRK